MKPVIRPAAGAVAFTVIAGSAFAQGIAVGGAGAGSGMGDSLVNFFYANFIHGIAAAGLLCILVGAVFMRSHIIGFVVVGICLLAIGNYQTILGLFNL